MDIAWTCVLLGFIVVKYSWLTDGHTFYSVLFLEYKVEEQNMVSSSFTTYVTMHVSERGILQVPHKNGNDINWYTSH